MIYIHLYFDPEEVQKFVLGETERLYGYNKDTKGERETVHLSVPLGKIAYCDNGEYELSRNLFKGEF